MKRPFLWHATAPLLVKARTNSWNAVYDYNIASATVDWASGATEADNARAGQ
jgi:hypothetical protein